MDHLSLAVKTSVESATPVRFGVSAELVTIRIPSSLFRLSGRTSGPEQGRRSDRMVYAETGAGSASCADSGAGLACGATSAS